MEAMNDEQICAWMGITAKEPLEAGEEAGIAKGRAEVVEWGTGPCVHYGNLGNKWTRRHCDECWDEQLKVWGLGDKAG